MSEEPSDTTVKIYADIVRRIRALPTYGSWGTVTEFVREAVRYYLQRQEERAGMVFSVDRQEDGKDREESP